MSSQEQKRTSIDTLPPNVAALIAEQIFSWRDIKSSGLRKRIPEEEGKEAVAIRTCNSTLNSLSLLSRRGCQLWRPFLLKHVSLDITLLTGFLTLVEKDPGMARFVQSLTLVSCREFKPVPFERSGADKAMAFMQGVVFLSPGYETPRPGLIIAAACSQRHRSASLALAQTGLVPNINPDDVSGERIAFSEQGGLIAKGIIAHSVGRILKACTNLVALSVNGGDVYFPFCERIERGGVKPFASFNNTLRVLNFRKWEFIHPVITSRNVIWLLVNLPNLEQACFYATLDKEDAKFIKEHKDTIRTCRSKVKDLDLNFLDHLSSDQDPEVSGEQAPITAIRSLLSSTTQNLATFSLRYEDFKTGGKPLDILVLTGLESSFHSLEKLKIESMGRFSREKGTVLTHFKALKIFASDGVIFSAIHRVGSHEASSEENYHPFPSNLKEVQLTCNYDGYASGDIPASEKGLSFPTEYYLARVVERLQNSSVERILTSKLPIDHHGKVIDKVFHGIKWKEARKELKKVCAKAGLKLVLVEEDF